MFVVVPDEYVIVSQGQGGVAVRVLGDLCAGVPVVETEIPVTGNGLSIERIFQSRLYRGQILNAEFLTEIRSKGGTALDALVGDVLALSLAQCGALPAEIRFDLNYFGDFVYTTVQNVQDGAAFDTLTLEVYASGDGYALNVPDPDAALDRLGVGLASRASVAPSPNKGAFDPEKFAAGAALYFLMMGLVGDNSPCWDDPDAFGC